MKRVFRITLAVFFTLCFFLSTSVYAVTYDEELPKLTAQLAPDSELLCKIEFGEGDNDISCKWRNPEQQSVCGDFTVSDDGTIFILNDTAPVPAVFAYSRDGKFMHRISCLEMAKPEQPQQDGFCPIADILYHDGCLYAVAKYNTETPALIKYTISDKQIEKIVVPNDVLSSIGNANFDFIFSACDDIVLVTSECKYVTYSAKEGTFLNESVVSVRKTDEKCEIDLCGKTYSVKAENLMWIRVEGQDADGNLITERSYKDGSDSVFISDNEGNTVGRLSCSATSCYAQRVSFRGNDLYCMIEDAEYIYVCKTGTNADFIATGIYDTDGDGNVTSADAVIVLRYCANMIADPFDKTFIKADANEDGIVNTSDAVTVLKVVAGIVD